jgi:trigger factor
MQASLETISTLERRLKVAVPFDQINTEIENRLKRLQRTVKLHGFRPGKVPFKVVEQQYGPQVRQEVLGDTVERTFGEAVKDKQLRVAGYPRIETVKPEAPVPESFEFTATFEIFPEVTLGDLSAASVERPAVVVGDAESRDRAAAPPRHRRQGSRRASERSRSASASLMNWLVALSKRTCRPRNSATLAAWQAMWALQAATALVFGCWRDFTQSRKSRTWNVAG